MIFSKPKVREAAVEALIQGLDVYTEAKMVKLMKKINGSPAGQEEAALKAAEQVIRRSLQMLI